MFCTKRLITRIVSVIFALLILCPVFLSNGFIGIDVEGAGLLDSNAEGKENLQVSYMATPMPSVNTITTVAGNGISGYSGDGSVAVSAKLNNPFGAAIDAAGNMYIADYSNQRIRKVDTNGIITTIAGNGQRGYSGDGGVATSAKLNDPTGVAVDNVGNLYIADADNHRIRKVDANGIITTVAGNGNGGYTGDGGIATSAQLRNPNAVAVDSSGNLFIADTCNHSVRKVSASGIITTLVGNGTNAFGGDGGLATLAKLNYPSAIATDNLGNLYIADKDNHRIRKVNTSGIISTVVAKGTMGYSGDGGSATSAQLNLPIGVTVDSGGNMYIAEFGNHCIRKVDVNGIITTVAGNGIAGYSGDSGIASAAALSYPRGVALDGAGNLYIAEYGNHRIRQVVFSTNATPTPEPTIAPTPIPTHITTFTIGTAIGKAGEIVEIPISISENQGIAAFGIILDYDCNALAPVSFDKGSVWSDDITVNLNYSSNQVLLAAASESNNYSNGTLLTVKFQIKQGAPDQKITLALTLDELITIIGDTQSSMLSMANNGRIDVINIIKGDVNEDGKITPADATEVLMNYVNMKIFTANQISAGDINGDGKLTASDATSILLKYLGLITNW